MSARVLTLIVNWRTADMTLRAAEAALVAMEGIDGGITIIDNDSGDGSYETLSQEVTARGWGRVRVLQSGHNGGFGAGNNVGIRAGLPEGRPDFVLTLNSDAFPAPGAIKALLTHLLAYPEAGFAGSYIHGPEGEPHLTTFRFPSIASEFEGAARIGPISRLLRHRAVPIPVPGHARPVDWLAGASLMMRMDALDQIGLFDESFFLYFEETDLCLRLARTGSEVHFVRDSEVMHLGSVSTGMKEWREVPGYWFDSRWHYFVKNHGRIYALAATATHAAGGILHRMRCLVTGAKKGDPPKFLRTLVAHDLRALIRPGHPAAHGAARSAG